MKRPRSKLKLAHTSDLPWIEVTFGSCLHKARYVENEILATCEKHHYGEGDLFALKLALEEALVNAVKHGNKMDSAKMVRVHYRVCDQRADITVEDEGTGFDPAELPDPTACENIERCSGRGILLMRAYMSSVVFNPQGNKVAMTKFNESYTVPASRAALG